MITANANYVLFEGSTVKYSSGAAIVDFSFNPQDSTFLVNIIPTTSSPSAARYGGHTYATTKTTVDAQSSSGTNPSDKLLYQVEEVIITYLDAITENSAVTFSH